MTAPLTVHVPGKPATKGSYRAVAKGVVVNDNPRTRSWQDAIAWAAIAARPGPRPMFRGYVQLRDVEFRFARGNAKAPYPRPDKDKLLRALYDGGTGVLWVDDSMIVGVEGHLRKRWGEPGATFTVEEVP